MKRIFGMQFAEMRDIENVRDAIFDKINEHRKATDHDFKVIESRLMDSARTVTDKTGELSDRIAGIVRSIADMRENTQAQDRVLDAFIAETFIHLPAKKNPTLSEYHHKRLEKAIAPKPEEQP